MTQQQQNLDRFRIGIFDKSLNKFCFGDFYWIRKYPENFTLLQSTGLKDKNGRLIYEGDILKIIPEDCKIFNRNNLSPVLCETFYKIEYEAFTGSLVAVNLANERHELSLNVNLANVSTIIGNIHTHPELLTAIETGEEIHL